MKFFAVALVTTLLSAEAFSQVRPGRGNYEEGRGGRYGRHVPAPDYNEYEDYNDGRPGYNDGRPGYNDGRPGYNDGRPGYNDGRPGYGRYTPVRTATYACYGADLIRNNRRVVYSFNGNSRCNLALSQVMSSGKFCDGADMYDLRGNYLKTYRNRAFCHARIHLLGK